MVNQNTHLIQELNQCLNIVPLSGLQPDWENEDMAKRFAVASHWFDTAIVQ